MKISLYHDQYFYQCLVLPEIELSTGNMFIYQESSVRYIRYFLKKSNKISVVPIIYIRLPKKHKVLEEDLLEDYINQILQHPDINFSIYFNKESRVNCILGINRSISIKSDFTIDKHQLKCLCDSILRNEENIRNYYEAIYFRNISVIPWFILYCSWVNELGLFFDKHRECLFKKRDSLITRYREFLLDGGRL